MTIWTAPIHLPPPQFLGNRQYFVSSDVGHGKVQWYGFHNEPAGGSDAEGGRKARLMEIFGTWCDAVTDLIAATPEEDVLRRDIYDRPPILTWAVGRVALLGDSAHAMQPNLGQGGCMAIEDAHYLGRLLANASDAAQAAGRGPAGVDVPAILREYQAARRIRCGAIHGMAGLAAIMASTYKAYLGEGLGPIGQAIEQLQIQHPGRVGGYFAMNAAMPWVLKWVLGGNDDVLGADRAGRCSLEEKPRAFTLDDFQRFLVDDDSMLAVSRSVMLLHPQSPGLKSFALRRGAAVAGSAPAADGGALAVHVAAHGVAPSHVRLEDENGLWYATDLGSESGTWVAAPARASVPLSWRRLAPFARTRVRAGDFLALGDREAAVFKVRFFFLLVC